MLHTSSCTLLCLLTCALLATDVQAMPGQGGESQAMDAAIQAFKKADKDGSDSLSKEEFMAAYPNMKEAAFTAIDTDKNGAISRQEWQTFVIGHSMGRSGQGSGMPGAQPGTQPAAPQPGKLPLVTPPAQGK